MVLMDMTVLMPIVEDKAMEGFNVDGGVAGGDGGTEEKTFVFSLVDFTEAEGGCWTGAGSCLCGVSGRFPERHCLGSFGIRVARVHDAEVVVVSRRAETSVMFGFSGLGSEKSKDTGKLLWYSQ